jgi:hypothetical protein
MNSSKKSNKHGGGKKRDEPTSSAGEQIDEMVKNVKNNKFNYGIMGLLAVLVFLSLYFQYKYERSRSEGYIGEDDAVESPYDILGVSYGADIKEVKKAYKQLAVVW